MTVDDPAGLARLREALEATRLNFGLTSSEITELVDAAGELGVKGICVPVTLLSTATTHAKSRGHAFERVTVANFPTGDHPPAAVRAQLAEAAAAGATEIDLVVPGRAVAERDWREVVRFVRTARAVAAEAAAAPIPLKVILETAAWDPERIRAAAEAAIDGGARWLKTSTGFHPAGGATIEAVRLLREIAPAGVGVKASGGIRDRAVALAMLEAGADRIGTSAERAILGTSLDRREPIA